MADGDPLVSTVGQLAELLKAGGPYTLAALGIAFGYIKDRALAIQSKEHFTEMAALHKEQTQAMIKVEATISSLKDLVQVLMREVER